MKPIFLVTPSLTSMQQAAERGSSVIERSKFFVHVQVPGPVAGTRINRLKSDQEYILLNIYRSAWGTSYQVTSLTGEPEALSHRVTFYGMNDVQRSMLSSFIGEAIADTSVASFKTKQYRALPLGVFTEVCKVMQAEGHEAVQHLSPGIAMVMRDLLIGACRRGGHDPEAKTRDAEYVGDPSLELTTGDMFPYNWELPEMGIKLVKGPVKSKKNSLREDRVPSLQEAGL